MMRAALGVVAVLAAASTASMASAQMPGAAAKRAATAAVNATNAHTDAVVKGAGEPVASQATTKPSTNPATPKPATPKAATPRAAANAGPSKVAKPGAKSALPSQPGRSLVIGARSDTGSPPPMIMREVFVYDAAGRRDPFVSLLTTSELRPALSDLRLTGILYDMSGKRPVATLRDITDNTQYTVTTGTALGRMRVAVIRPKTVVFSIDEFGASRLDSLVLGDSTKVRAK